MTEKTLFVVDGHALCYRAYFALQRNPLINSKGQNVSAIYGFFRMLLRLLQTQKPDYTIVAFDPPKKSFRFEMYPEYKAQRAKMPDDLRSQIEEIKEMLKEMGFTVVIMDNYEADDVLGSVASQYSGKYKVVLVTGDKDAYQLLTHKNISIYAGKKGITEFESIDANAVVEKLGVKPEQIIDYMALTGDAVDNIPGVKGIGEKTAAKLLQKYGTLDNIYLHLHELTGKIKEQIESQKDMAYLSRQLVTIRTDIQLPLTIENALTPDLHNEKVRQIFKRLEMDSIARELFDAEKSISIKEIAGYSTITDIQTLTNVITAIKNAGIVSFDTETTSSRPMEAELVGVSFSIAPQSGWFIPVGDSSLWGYNAIPKDQMLELIKSILEDETIKKVGQNIKYDMLIMLNCGITVKGIYFDTMVASYLLNPGLRRHNLDDLASEYLNYTKIRYDELIKDGKKIRHITEVPLQKLSHYAIEDADIALRLYQILYKKLEDENLLDLFFNVEMPLVTVLAYMEYYGVKIDLDHFESLSKELSNKISETEKKIYSLAGVQFNINSTRELSHILFEKIGLKPVKKTKTGFSTDIQVLEALLGQHEIIDYLMEYRTLSKLQTTYVDALPVLVNPKTGRIHTSFNQTVTATGRLSSSDPNLQNIPIRDEFGKNIRAGFVVDDGCLMFSADYSQIELRLAAHLSKDPTMIEAFHKGIDIHAQTASSVFNVPIEEVTDTMRRQAKIINFATIYGVSPYGLSQQADISVEEATKFIEKYFAAYPKIKEYIESTIAFARKNGYVQTLLGRKRYIPEITSTNQFRREGAERIAINTPIQGTSADMIKVAMINIHKMFCDRHLKSRMILQVHDELVFEVPENEKSIVEEIVIGAMKNAIKLDVPVVVDTGWGKNWAQAH
ncbi:MAG: DNA polymerase I [Spirochaetes bacterium]|nr:DNA polymerase I [Spirochaetota bacterium]